MKIFKSLLSAGATLLILGWLLPTVSYLNVFTLINFSLIFLLIQKIIKPILKIFFLPINVVTLGFFSLVINVALLWLTIFLVPGLTIRPMTILGWQAGQFSSLVIVSMLMSLIFNLLNHL